MSLNYGFELIIYIGFLFVTDYGVGYQYNPACTGPVEQDYLPPELLGVNFFAKDAT